MSSEGRETDYLKIRVDLRAVVDDFPLFPIQGSSLIAPEPLGIHVGKQAAKGTADQLLKGQLFQLCKCGIAISEDPVHGVTVLVKDHLNIRKRKGQIVKASVIVVILLLCFRDVLPRKAVDHLLLNLLQTHPLVI